MAACALVLVHYTPAVVNAVTDPYSGIASRKTDRGYSGLPDIAEIKEACEVEAMRAARLANGGRRLSFEDRKRDARPAEVLATIFTAVGYPRYDALKERHEKEAASPCYFENRKMLDEVERYGIWTPYAWVAPDSVARK